jgi:hypothetical protein
MDETFSSTLNLRRIGQQRDRAREQKHRDKQRVVREIRARVNGRERQSGDLLNIAPPP